MASPSARRTLRPAASGLERFGAPPRRPILNGFVTIRPLLLRSIDLGSFAARPRLCSLRFFSSARAFFAAEARDIRAT